MQTGASRNTAAARSSGKAKGSPDGTDLAELAAELGRITEVEPAGRRADGAPELGPGQVFVTKYGRLFHRGWCTTVGHYWDQHGRLQVTTDNLVGRRKPCQECSA